MDVVLIHSFIDFITAFLSLTSASIFYITYKLIDSFDLHPPCFTRGASKYCTGHKCINLTGHHCRHHEHTETLGEKKFGVCSLDRFFQSNIASITDNLEAVNTQFKVDPHPVPDNEDSKDLIHRGDVGKLCGDHQSPHGHQIAFFKRVGDSVQVLCEVGDNIKKLNHQAHKFNESEKENEGKMDMVAEITSDNDHGDDDLEGGCFDDIEKLKEELSSQRQILDRTYEELEKQRIASASAASEAMAVISKLQKEKAEIEMEAVQYLRMAFEKEAFDEKAIVDLRDSLVKQEAEVLALEKEMEICRRIAMENVESAGQRHERKWFQDGTAAQNPTFCGQRIQMNALHHQISKEMLHQERNPIVTHTVIGNPSKVPINDFRTVSMVQRDHSRVLLKEEVCSLESKLNMLQTDRKLLKDTIKLKKSGHERVLSLTELAKEMEVEVSPAFTQMHDV